MHKLIDLLQRFRDDQRGAFLALFGILAVVLIATAGATVDFTSVQNARTRAQVALDAAALALQPKIYDATYTTEQIRAAAEALVLNRLGDASITAKVTKAEPDKTLGTLRLTATLKAPLIFVALVGVKEMNMTLVSQATKGSQDLEVAVALDVTGSMKGSKISALISAANDMVDILVQDQQTPTYTKMALVPWSMGVNVGSYANAVRGTPTGAATVTAAGWQNGTNKTITGITKANPAVVTTSAAHGLTTGDTVWISGITANSAWTALNNRKYTVTVTSTTKFRLDSTNTSGYSSNWSAGGIVRECTNPNCEIVITSANHGYSNGDVIFYTGVGGMTQLNSSSTAIGNESPTYYTVASSTSANYSLSGIIGPNVSYSTYTSGGSSWCTKYGCSYYRFQNPSGDWRLYKPSTCVTERTISPNQYTDAAPSTTFVGVNYLKDPTDCVDSQIVPLTSNKTTLHNTINGFAAVGSTAGQTGFGWAWYMLAPNFAYLWPTDSKPAAYKKANLIKVVVLMTDGSFNSVYCNGVISRDSTSGSGSGDDHINCNAQNGEPFAQAKALCDGMKASTTGIIVYTIGFDISDQTDEKDLMNYCATDLDKAYLADDSLELTQAFKSIAQDIAQLRLTQ